METDVYKDFSEHESNHTFHEIRKMSAEEIASKSVGTNLVSHDLRLPSLRAVR